MRSKQLGSAVALVGVAMWFTFAGCGSPGIAGGGDGGAALCTVGKSIACACTSGASGSQTCEQGGTYAACVCVTPDAGTGSTKCIENMTAACACPTGMIGAQTCLADGTYTTCSCTTSPSDGGVNKCVQGASRACACTDGASGAQQCQADGSYAACACTSVSDGGTMMCAVGQSIACSCTDGGSGAQVCQPGGTYAACVCTSGLGDGGSPPSCSAPSVSMPCGCGGGVMGTRCCHPATGMCSACSCSASGPGDAGVPLCIPNSTNACTCSDGKMGAQTCQTDGTYDVCVCTSVDAGGPICVTGMTTACACTDGQIGAQPCLPGGGAYGACVCTSVDGGVIRCIGGSTLACTCTNGEMGAQICMPGGTYAACVCSTPDLGAPDLAVCVAGTTCALVGDACHVGATACNGTTATCSASGNQPDGLACGGNNVCAAGQCVACTANTMCTPTNACHVGVSACGPPACVDTNVNLTDGTDCTASGGMPSTCHAGVCVGCVSNMTCTPSATPCMVGVSSCATGSFVCNATTVAVTDGTACVQGAGSGSCTLGVCILARTLSTVSGDMQTGYIDQELQPVVVKITDVNGPVANVTLMVAPAPGAAFDAASLVSDATGQVTFTPRVGRATGPYLFTVTAPNAAMSLTLTATATAPPTGTLFTLVDVTHGPGNSGFPGPGTTAKIGTVNGFKLTSDGTIYYADSGTSRIMMLSPQGVLTSIAGNGTAGEMGDNGFADQAEIDAPFDVAVDEVNQVLYFSENANPGRVRAVDLTTNIITTVAGGTTTAPGPAYGDTGAAVSAYLASPTYLTMTPDGRVLISDTSHNRIRALSPGSGIINNWLGHGAYPNDCSVNISIGFSVVGGDGGQVVYDAAGNAWITGYWFGSEVNAPTRNCDAGTAGGAQIPAVAQMTPGGVFTAFAGATNGLTADGTPGSNYTFARMPTIALDTAGNIYFAEPGSDKIMKEDAGSGKMFTFSGAGVPGYSGDYISAGDPTVEFNNPTMLVSDAANNFYVADTTNYAIRQLYTAGSSTRLVSSLALVSGDMQTMTIDAVPNASFRVKLLDSSHAALDGYTVNWSVVTPGGGLYNTTSLTDAAGTTKVLGRPGLSIGAYQYQASFNDPYGNPVSGSPVTFTINTTAPIVGDIFTVVDGDHGPGNNGAPGSAVLAHVGQITGVKQSTDGSVYFADYSDCLIRKLTPAGEIINVAGTGTCGYSGDLGPATQANINAPYDLAIDDVNHLLYFTQNANPGAIRVVDISSSNGAINLYAGGLATAPGPGYGDSGPATDAYIANPTFLTLAPGNLLLVSDTSHNRIRSVDTGTGLINNWLSHASYPNNCAVNISVGFNVVGGDGGQVVYDSTGVPWISGYWFGSSVNAPTRDCDAGTAGGAQIPAIVHGGIVAVGSNTSWACPPATTCTSSTNPGALATQYSFAAMPDFALDSHDVLYFSEATRYRIQYLDATGHVQLYAGNSLLGYAGDYVPVAQSQLNQPSALQFLSNGNFVIADDLNYCLRMVWE